MGTDVGMGEGEAVRPEQASKGFACPTVTMAQPHCGSVGTPKLLSGRMARGVQVGQSVTSRYLAVHLSALSLSQQFLGLGCGNRGIVRGPPPNPTLA